MKRLLLALLVFMPVLALAQPGPLPGGSGTAGAATNVVWPVKGTNTTATTNGLTVAITTTGVVPHATTSGTVTGAVSSAAMPNPLWTNASTFYLKTNAANGAWFGVVPDVGVIKSNAVTGKFSLLNTNGSLGIGTVNPSEAVDVEVSRPSIRVSDTDVAGSGGFFSAYGNVSSFANNRKYGGSSLSTGKAAAQILLYADNLDSSITFHTTSANNVDPAEAMRISKSGNVGIGTNSPQAALHVLGNGLIDGDFTVTGTASFLGASGQSTVSNLTVNGTITGAGTNELFQTGTNVAWAAAQTATNLANLNLMGLSAVNATNLYNANLPVPTNSPAYGNRIVATSASSARWITGNLTNQNYVRPDFQLPYSELTTNAAFAFLTPTNVVTTEYQTAVVMVTNSTAAAVAVTAPANVHASGTMYITNVTVFSFFNCAGRWTNMIAYPLW